MSETTITAMMEDFARDAVNIAKDQYQTRLDYSGESIRAVEKLLDDFYRELPRAESGEISRDASVHEMVDAICNIFGGYIGEVIRRQHGGEWKIEAMVSDKPMLCLQVEGTYMFPPAKVYKRLASGPGDDLWFYYEVCRQKLEEQAENG